MKKQLFSILLVAFSTMIMAQTNATNFTCNDCLGVSHELFKVLDSGKIVVLVWVMPCGACTGGAITAYNIVKSYQANNPNKVYFYLVDDYANTNCQSLGSWGASNGLDLSSYSYRFSNAAIKMTNYGSAGMPKCVVLAGTDHKVMYNINNSVSSTDLQKAINTALVLTGTTEDNVNGSALKISPNPVNESAILTCTLDQASNVKIELLNADGKLVQTVFAGKLNSGENKMNLNVANYHSGIYYVTLSSGDKIKSTKFSVVH